ncbi:MAG: membrane dipeptidase, partial [Bacteroidota bacterium]
SKEYFKLIKGEIEPEHTNESPIPEEEIVSTIQQESDIPDLEEQLDWDNMDMNEKKMRYEAIATVLQEEDAEDLEEVRAEFGLTDSESDETIRLSKVKLTQLRHLINNILHIVKVIGKEEAWNHISIGSDYDGFIKPIAGIKSSKDMEKLETLLNDHILKMVDEAKDQGVDYFVDKDNIEKRVRGFMYDNLKRFLDDNFLPPQA